MKILFALTALLLFVTVPAQAKGKGKGKGNLEAAFKKMDANGDGKISLAEFEAHSKKAAKAAKAAQHFKKIDKDHDGFLSEEEFKAGHHHKKKK